uniref:Uncharacterized protein n=1 Tax=viral metagenome TaxID=1070528 RepID=A0A6C0F4H4_9ZZZZ
MNWVDKLIILLCLVSIGVNIYIMVYEIEHQYKWFFLFATVIAIVFELYRLYGATFKKSIKHQ